MLAIESELTMPIKQFLALFLFMTHDPGSALVASFQCYGVFLTEIYTTPLSPTKHAVACDILNFFVLGSSHEI